MPTTGLSSSSNKSANIQPQRKTRVILYDVDEVARFLHAVAYARIGAQNTTLLRGSIFQGGDQVETGDYRKIKNDADRLAAVLMTEFSHRCKIGVISSVPDFLDHQRLLYREARQQIDRVFSQVRQSNQQLARNWEIGTDILHIIHGAANASFTSCSFFAGPGAGTAVAGVLNTADGLISQKAVIGIVKQGGEDLADKVAEKAGERYGQKVTKTLVNIVTRDWKYQGALQNAQVRLAKQTGLAVGAKTLHFYFAVKGLKDNMEEIEHAFGNLRQTGPSDPAQVKPVPDLKMPTLR